MNAEWFGIRESFIDADALKGAERCGGDWMNVEKCLRDMYSKELSPFKPNLFTYFLVFGLISLLSMLFVMKVLISDSSSLYFLVKLIFIVSAMFSLKGFVGHFVVVFLNRDRFESELRSLKSRFEAN